ncbi:odorant receptor 10-like isoform X1 [Temnothorax longispinosus]|uniref:odorant receptor 10-like isoform X1 n=1 Tax=Temnothorax longispinosus TaxID=300112 RepID=UPI003A99196D
MPRIRLFLQSSAKSVTATMSSIRDRSATSQNSSYQRDIQYVFKLNNWILGSLGIWPVAIRGIGQHVSKIAIAVFNLALSFAIVPCALHIVYDERDIILRLKLFGLLAFCLTAMTKYCIFVIRRPKIHRCIEYVKSDWWQVTFRSDRELMLKYAATGRNLTIIGASFMYTAGIIYHLILPFCTEHKVNNQTIRPLVYPTYSKFSQSQISPVYEIVYVAHCMCGYTIYSVTAGACGLAALFATHACGQIQILVSRLEDLLAGERFEQNPNVHHRIAAIVKNHVRVIRFASVVEEVLQEVCLVEFSSSVCTICLLEYYCIVDWKADDRIGLATYFLLFVSFCFNIFILCYIGEVLMEKSSQIGSICYMINWYQLSPKSTRSLILIIAMASHPIKFSAGRMVDLSLTTFGNVRHLLILAHLVSYIFYSTFNFKTQ